MAVSTYYLNRTGTWIQLAGALNHCPPNAVVTVDAEPFVDYNLQPGGYLSAASPEICSMFCNDAVGGIRIIGVHEEPDWGCAVCVNWMAGTYSFAIPMDAEVTYWFEPYW